MNDQERQQFSGMFRINVILLDVIIIAAAIAIAVGIIAPNDWGPKFPIVIGCGVLALVLLVVFIRYYRSTKAWLDIHGTTKGERLAAAQAKADEERARIRAELEAELRAEIEAEKKAEAAAAEAEQPK